MKGNKKPRNRSNGMSEFENRWLHKRILHHFKSSKLSHRKWMDLIGLEYNKSGINVTYLMRGDRGFTFPLAVRLATGCGINLSELQKELK